MFYSVLKRFDTTIFVKSSHTLLKTNNFNRPVVVEGKITILMMYTHSLILAVSS